MTFLNDLWTKFKKKPSKNPPVSEKPSAEQTSGSPSSSVLQNAENVFHAFEHLEMEQQLHNSVKSNLKALKELVDAPQKPPEFFSTIKKHLGDPECYETVRQERMQPNFHCPDCHSGNLKRLMQLPSQSPNKHRYQCQDCGLVFNDDTGTPLEKNVPPLNIWMQCWYLMGCTESLTYIASKLNLDLATVEMMVEQLRLIFKAHKPLTRFIAYEEWHKQSAHLRNQLKEELLKQYERLSADIAGVPKDTAEFRRQQNLRRDLVSTTAPPTGGKKR